jgi:hypothetical protein
MASDKRQHYQAVLADLEAQRAALDQAIAAIRLVMAQQPPELPRAVGVGAPGELRSDAFIGLTIPDAVKKFLQTVKEKQTSEQIAEGLRRGGFQSNAKDFAASVQTTLRRYVEENSDMVRVGKTEWGLPEWYGPRVRRKGPLNGKDRDEGHKSPDEDASDEPSEREGASKH